jgi:hypothetical protein
MKIKLLFLSLLIFLSVFSVSFAAEEICFPEDQAKKLVYELEQCRNIQDQVDLYRQENDQLEKQVGLLKEIINLKDQQLKISEKSVDQYKDLLQYQQKTYEQIVKDNQPSVGKEIIKVLGYIGIGVLIGLIF